MITQLSLRKHIRDEINNTLNSGNASYHPTHGNSSARFGLNKNT